MVESKKTTTKWFPSLQDYNEAVQTPRACLQDPELREALPYRNALGLPRAVTGSFASVYRLHRNDRDYALRFFLTNVEDQAERYALIGECLKQNIHEHTVNFNFLPQGIKVKDTWMPALKMDWVDGKHLDTYVIENIENPDKLGSLIDNFVRMMEKLRFTGIAHGDLQHGNIIVEGSSLRLVDYDGMYVPQMTGMLATEIGHPNFQHPARAAHHFGPYLDSFSAWLIYASLRALQLDPKLWTELSGGDDCLLFKQSDLANPTQSKVFESFERHENKELQALSHFLKAQLLKDVTQVPYLELSNPELLECFKASGASFDPKYQDDRLERLEHLEHHEHDEPGVWLKTENIGKLLKAPIGWTLKQSTDNQSLALVIPPKTTLDTIWVKPTAEDFAASEPKELDPQSKLFPPELIWCPIPREVVWKRRNGINSPGLNQALLLLSPLTIIMYLIFTGAFEGHHGHTSPDNLTQGILCLTLFLYFESLIWSEALNHRHLAVEGIAVLGSIDTLWAERGYFSKCYWTSVSYEVKNVAYITRIKVPWDVGKKMAGNSKEVILCDPRNKTNAVFYRLCMYKPVDPSQTVQRRRRP